MFSLVGSLHQKFTFDELQNLVNSQALPNGEVVRGTGVRPSSCKRWELGKPLGFKLVNRSRKE